MADKDNEAIDIHTDANLVIDNLNVSLTDKIIDKAEKEVKAKLSNKFSRTLKDINKAHNIRKKMFSDVGLKRLYESSFKSNMDIYKSALKMAKVESESSEEYTKKRLKALKTLSSRNELSFSGLYSAEKKNNKLTGNIDNTAAPISLQEIFENKYRTSKVLSDTSTKSFADKGEDKALKLQKEKDKKEDKERKEAKKFRNKIVGGVSKVASLITRAFTFTTVGAMAVAQRAERDSLGKSQFETNVGLGASVPLARWEKLYRVFAGQSREQTQSMFQRLSSEYAKARLGKSQNQESWNLLRVSTLSSDPYKMHMQLLQRLGKIQDRAIRRESAMGVFGTDTPLLMAEKLKGKTPEEINELYESILTPEERANIEKTGQSFRALKESIKDLSDTVASNEQIKNFFKFLNGSVKDLQSVVRKINEFTEDRPYVGNEKSQDYSSIMNKRKISNALTDFPARNILLDLIKPALKESVQEIVINNTNQVTVPSVDDANRFINNQNTAQINSQRNEDNKIVYANMITGGN